jgi:hypothetical protein
MILGSDLIYQAKEISNLKRWMISDNKTTLFDISSWNEDGSQKDWIVDESPVHL